MASVIIVGGGIVGAACAERLSRAGHEVVLIERGQVGDEASRAGAGLLTPVHPWNYPEPLLELDEACLPLWPELAERLRTETGTDIEYRRTGLLALILTDEDEAEADRRVVWKRTRGEVVERLTTDDALRVEPALSPDVRGALHFPELAQVRNHRVAPALATAAEARGARILERTSVLGLIEEEGRCVGVRTGVGERRADHVVVAAGAWSGGLLAAADCPSAAATIPARGQMLLLRTRPGSLTHMVLGDGHYLVPRRDGRVLVGSTVEYVGFDRRVTVDGVSRLTAALHRLAPGLDDAELETTWAGLRPDSPDHMPLIGPVRPGLLLATGHFRNGVMLAPITAEIVLELVESRCRRDLSPFSPWRV